MTTRSSRSSSTAGHLTQLQDRLDADEAYKEDIYADVPENILDLYRDKPLEEGGVHCMACPLTATAS